MYKKLMLTFAAWVGAAAAGYFAAGAAGLAFAAGLIVMDIAWSVKLGIPQSLYYQWKHRNDPIPSRETEDDDLYSNYN